MGLVALPAASKKRPAGACIPAGGRDAGRRISSARRRAWPRSWVVMTILVPARVDRAVIDCPRPLRVAAGSRLAVGSSEEQHLGAPRAQARARARRCCSPIESTRAACRRASAARPARSKGGVTAPAGLVQGRRMPRRAKGVVHVAGGGAAQHDRALEHQGLTPPSRGPARSGARRISRPWLGLRSGRAARRRVRLLPAPLGPEDHGAWPGFQGEADLLDQLPPGNAQADVGDPARQDRGLGPVLHAACPRALAGRSASSFTMKAAAFTRSVSTIRMIPRPRARARLPFEVSRAMAVVMTRVT